MAKTNTRRTAAKPAAKAAPAKGNKAAAAKPAAPARGGKKGGRGR